jgi:hypothetical protein
MGIEIKGADVVNVNCKVGETCVAVVVMFEESEDLIIQMYEQLISLIKATVDCIQYTNPYSFSYFYVLK